jgi:dCTP deaminase
MILSGKAIEQEIIKGSITISPYNPEQLGVNSYNLRLHNEMLQYSDHKLDMSKNNPTDRFILPERGLLLYPGTVYLGRTIEHTETHNFIPMLEGRSSIGRLGMFIHVTAGFGDIGFKGFWTLEIAVIQPLLIYPSIEIAQIYYHTVSKEHKEYCSPKYQDNTDIQASKLYTEF